MRYILVADDYFPFLEDTVRLLGNQDTEIVAVETAAQALEAINQRQFDLVITDLLMETQTADDGFAVVSAAKRSDLTQVIVVTAFGKPELSVESMRLGAFDYLERGTPGTDFRAMLVNKVRLAFDYRTAKLAAVKGS